MKPAVASLLVVAYNSGDYLQACLDSLAAQTMPEFECLVADNASTDDSIARLTLPDERFRLISMGANLGFAAANNNLSRLAVGENLVLINPDAVAEPDFLKEMLAMAERRPEAGAIGAIQRKLDNPDQLDGVGDCWHASGLSWRDLEGRPICEAPGDGEIFAPCAAAALYRRRLFLELGGFDERYFCYCEDTDLGFRIRLAGWTCQRASRAHVWHAGSAAAGRNSDFTLYHSHRNRIWTFVKNTPAEIFWFALPYHVAVNAYLLARAFGAGFEAPLARGYKDALKGLPAILKDRKALAPRLGATLKISSFFWSPRLPNRRK